MKSTVIRLAAAAAALTLLLSSSVASATMFNGSPSFRRFDPEGEYGDVEPYQITFSDALTETVIHTETMSWQATIYTSGEEEEEEQEEEEEEEEDGEPRQIIIAASYDIPHEIRNFGNLRYLLTGGPGDTGLPTSCALIHDDDTGVTTLPLDLPISGNNPPPISSVACMAVVKVGEA